MARLRPSSSPLRPALSGALVDLLPYGLVHGAPVAPPRLAGSNLGYAIGDSRFTATTSPAGGYNQRYPLTPARQLLNGQLHLPYGNIQAVGGYTIAQVRDNLFAGAMASTAKVLIVLAGTNDGGSNPVANAAIIAAMADDWVDSAPDRVIVILDEVPWGGASSDKAGHQTLRDGIRALADPARGIYIAPSWRAVTGGDDGTVPLADTYRDDRHFAIPGSIRVGRALAEALAPLLPAYDFFGQATALAQAFGAGTLAANDIGTNSTLSAGSYTTSMVLHEGEYWLQVQLNNALGAVNVYRSSSTVPAGWVAGTTLFESNMDFILLEGHENIRQASFYAVKQSGQNEPHYSTGAGVGDANHSGSTSDALDLSYPAGEYRGTYWSPRFRHAADATQLRPWWVNIVSRTSLPMKGTLLLRRPQTRVVS